MPNKKYAIGISFCSRDNFRQEAYLFAEILRSAIGVERVLFEEDFKNDVSALVESFEDCECYLVFFGKEYLKRIGQFDSKNPKERTKDNWPAREFDLIQEAIDNSGGEAKELVRVLLPSDVSITDLPAGWDDLCPWRQHPWTEYAHPLIKWVIEKGVDENQGHMVWENPRSRYLGSDRRNEIFSQVKSNMGKSDEIGELNAAVVALEASLTSLHNSGKKIAILRTLIKTQDDVRTFCEDWDTETKKTKKQFEVVKEAITSLLCCFQDGNETRVCADRKMAIRKLNCYLLLLAIDSGEFEDECINKIIPFLKDFYDAKPKQIKKLCMYANNAQGPGGEDDLDPDGKEAQDLEKLNKLFGDRLADFETGLVKMMEQVASRKEGFVNDLSFVDAHPSGSSFVKPLLKYISKVSGKWRDFVPQLKT